MPFEAPVTMATFPESLLIEFDVRCGLSRRLSLIREFRSSELWNDLSRGLYGRNHEADLSPVPRRDNPGGYFPCAVRSRADRHLRQHRFFAMSAKLRGVRANQRPDHSEIDPVATFQRVARGGAHPVRAARRRSEEYLSLRRARTALSRAHPVHPEPPQKA